MAYWLIDPTNNIELKFDTIQSIRQTSLSEIKKYNSQSDNEARVLYSNPLPLTVTVSGLFHATTTSFTDYMRKLLYFDKCGEELLLIDGHNGQAYLGYLEAPNFGKSDETNFTLPFQFSFIMKGQCVGFMAEAEDVNGAWLSPGVVTADANASEGYSIVCNANLEGGSIEITQSEWKMPIGDYRIYVRAKDSAHVANDLYINTTNATDSSVVASGTKTLTASYVWYTLDATLAADDLNNILVVQAYKGSATTNNISIDMIVCVAI